MKRFLVLFVPAIVILSFAGCDLLFNTPPDLTSVTAPVDELAYGGSTTITAVAADDQDEVIFYSFAATIGTLSAASNTTGIVTYTAPAWTEGIADSAVITVTANDLLSSNVYGTNRDTLTIPLYRIYDLTFQINNDVFADNDVDVAEIYLNGALAETVYQTDVASYTGTNYGTYDVTYRGYLSQISIHFRQIETAYYIDNIFYYLDDSDIWDDPDTAYSPAAFSEIRYIRFSSLYNSTWSRYEGAGIYTLDPASFD